MRRVAIRQVLGDPRIQLPGLTFREQGTGLGSAEEHERLDDPPELDRTPERRCEDTAIFLARSLLAQGDLDLSDQDRQRRPQLVRRVAAEPPLAPISDVKPGKEFVEC